VLTQPDRAAGRGLQSAPSAVKRLALARSLALFQPGDLASPEVIQRVQEAGGAALIVAAYGKLLPAAMLSVAPMGAINIHASLLPRWRGAAPIQRALLEGDAQTGISIMQMDEGLDTGPIIARASLAIERDDDAGTLHDKLASLGAGLIVQTLARSSGERLPSAPQPLEGATYARKLERMERTLEWRLPAAQLERKLRAFRPAPGASARFRGEVLKLWRARVVEGKGEPGTVLSADAGGVVVACGVEALSLTELQREGGRRMAASEFLHGHRIAPGARFE
jgi:methionyl-tRNA formyltransferase